LGTPGEQQTRSFALGEDVPVVLLRASAYDVTIARLMSDGYYLIIDPFLNLFFISGDDGGLCLDASTVGNKPLALNSQG